jgi:hypothetical protein
MFASHAEKVFCIAMAFFAFASILYVQAITRIEHPIAWVMMHKRRQAIAELYLRLGSVGYITYAVVITAFVFAVLREMQWQSASLCFATLAGSFILARLIEFGRLDAADLAAAQLFMDHDLKSSGLPIHLK